MRKYGLFSTLILLVAASCDGHDGHFVASRWPTPEARDTIYVESVVVDNTQLLYEHFDVEYLLCLEGRYIRPHYVEIEDFRVAHLTETDRVHAKFDVPCHAVYPRTVATLHNHRNGDPDHLCYLSANDINVFIHSPHRLMVVQCGPRRWAFFTRDYVDRFPDAKYLPAIAGYMAEFPVDSASNSTGKVDG